MLVVFKHSIWAGDVVLLGLGGTVHNLATWDLDHSHK